jgi:hypothetical protein
MLTRGCGPNDRVCPAASSKMVTTNFGARCACFRFSFHHLAHPMLSRLAMSPLKSPQWPQYQTLLRIPLLQTIRLRQPTFPGCHSKNLPRRPHNLGERLLPHAPTLPNLLCSSPKLPRTAPIGFFIHVASSRIFRCLSVAEDLLLGLLGVDLVVFTVPDCQLRTPLPTDCFTHIGVRGPSQGDSSPGGTQRPSGGWLPRPRRVGFVDDGVFNPMGIDVKEVQLRSI